MYKVRFHLGKGEHFMHWQVHNLIEDTIQYVDPQQHGLLMFGCKLRNQKGGAQKIHDGANKSVVAWIDCEYVNLNALRINTNKTDYEHLRYNPRIAPNWTSSEQIGIDMDNTEHGLLVTMGRDVLKIIN